MKTKIILLSVLFNLSLNTYPQSKDNKYELISIIEEKTTYVSTKKYFGAPDNIINKKKSIVAGITLGGQTLYEFNKKGIRLFTPDNKPNSIISEMQLYKPFSDTLSNGLFIGILEEDAIHKCNSLYSLENKYLNTISQYAANSNYYVYQGKKIIIALTTKNGIVEQIGICKNESSENSELDKFRVALFGITTEEVKTLEKAKFIQSLENGDEETLVFSGTVGGKDCDIFYNFIKNRFLMGGYYFTEEHTNYNLYIDDYETILSSLKDKYGKPTVEEFEWLNDLYREDNSEWGFAVSLGHLKYYAKWKFINGSIFTVLKGDNYKINHLVRYSTDDYEIENEEVKNNLNEF